MAKQRNFSDVLEGGDVIMEKWRALQNVCNMIEKYMLYKLGRGGRAFVS